MKKTIIAIIGRANVGKSTLFNRMIKASANRTKASAITENIPGVTRDRNYAEIKWEGKSFIVVDTGGFYAEEMPNEDVEILRQMKEQALFAIQEADLIIHLLDGSCGLNPSDIELANFLRSSGKKILWVVNKIDTHSKEDRLFEFYRIGSDEIIPLSALTGYGFDELMDKIVSFIPKETEVRPEEVEIPRIAVVGRPNVGKSTLINSLLGKKRLIVSPTAGTTRDSIDSICSFYGKKYIFIDTAGIRNKAKLYPIERFSMVRAMRSIEQADVVIIVLDASQGIVEQDKKIAGIVKEYGKGAIFLLNKWDLIKEPDSEYKKITKELKQAMWFMDYAPYLTTSGIEKKRITKIFPLIDEIIAEREKRIPTSDLNKLLSKIISEKPLPSYKGKELKFFYITQFDIKPPTFVIFVNYPKGVKPYYIRYIEKILRETYSFKGSPIRIYVKSR